MIARKKNPKYFDKLFEKTCETTTCHIIFGIFQYLQHEQPRLLHHQLHFNRKKGRKMLNILLKCLKKLVKSSQVISFLADFSTCNKRNRNYGTNGTMNYNYYTSTTLVTQNSVWAVSAASWMLLPDYVLFTQLNQMVKICQKLQ